MPLCFCPRFYEGLQDAFCKMQDSPPDQSKLKLGRRSRPDQSHGLFVCATCASNIGSESAVALTTHRHHIHGLHASPAQAAGNCVGNTKDLLAQNSVIKAESVEQSETSIDIVDESLCQLFIGDS